MYPELLKLGPVTIYSFGLMAAIGFLMGGYLLEKEMVRIGKDKELAGSIILSALIGGIVGAKAYYLVINPQLLEHDLWGAVFSGAGLDYGPPSDLPWAIAFPDGVVPTEVPVHPTMVYDFILLFSLFFVLWKLRLRNYKRGTIFGIFAVFMGAERFFTEFWRLEPKYIFGIFSEAQMISIILFVSGWSLIYYVNKLQKEA